MQSESDTHLSARLQARLDGLTKPLGSLGYLEHLALKIGCIQNTDRPRLTDPQLVVFAADHGLVAQGVSAYPGEVTAQMVENFLSGGAAVNVLARQHHLALTVVDAGVRVAISPRDALLDRKVARGTADSSNGPAMSLAQRDLAMARGREIVQSLPGNVLLLGEMGIGNTSSAALLTARLTGADIDDCIGRGTGLGDEGLLRKRAVLRRVFALHSAAAEPMDALAAFGGFEIAMMIGAALEAARTGRLVVVDGFICGAAILLASRLDKTLPAQCIHSHRSAEPGHRLVLEALGALPLLDLDLRLGEGTGAALAWPLIDSAVRLLNEMASFHSAGVSTRLADKAV